jgi:hypothetical protein
VNRNASRGSKHAGSKSAPGRLLTIATVAFKHHDWLSVGFVTNRPARAAASERYFHVHFLVFCYSLVEKRSANPVLFP